MAADTNAGATGTHLDPATSEASTRAIAKAARRFLPLIVICYFFNYLDRTSVGFAALTMNRDLGLSATAFGWGAGVLFAGYCFFEIPSNLVLYRVGARRWIARIMITWGVIAAANALVVGPHSFYLARFLLGTAEAGFAPGITFFLAAWFPPEYRARMLAWYLLAIPLSSLIGGPVSALLLQLDGWMGLAGWQWMFIVEGLPATLLGIVVLFMLRDGPQQAEWLTAEEKAALTTTLATEQRDRAPHSLMPALKDIRVLTLAAIQFGFTLGSYGVGIWLPQMLKAQGLTNLAIGFVSAIPYIFASIGMLIWAYYVDRTGQKIVNLTLGNLMAAVGTGGRRHLDRCGAVADWLDHRAGWRHLRAGNLLDRADEFSDRRCRGGRSGVHQLDRDARRLCRAVSGRLDQGHDRLVHARPARDGGPARHRDRAVGLPEIPDAAGVAPPRLAIRAGRRRE